MTDWLPKCDVFACDKSVPGEQSENPAVAEDLVEILLIAL